MNVFDGSEEEDNNPFSGTTHLYASGIAAVTDARDDYDFPEPALNFENNSDSNIEHSRTDVPNVIAEADERELDVEDDTLHSWKFATSELSRNSVFETSYMNLSHGEDAPEAIRIIDAGQYKDGYGKYAIGYKIEFGGIVVTRRYSEFDSLRQSLCRLLPTIIIPPIPSKHPIIKYIFNPLHVEKDIRTINRRQRLLARFLNNCHKVQEIRDHVVFQKFLNPEYFWKEVLSSPPISILPMNNLLAPPLNPTKPSPLHVLLPTPSTLTMHRRDELIAANDETEKKFVNYNSDLVKLKEILQPLHKTGRNIRTNIQNYSNVLSELGAYFNAYSLENSVFQVVSLIDQMNRLSMGIEKVGQSIDVSYVSTELLSEGIVFILEERTKEMLQFIHEAQRVLQFRNFKQEQYYTIEKTIKKRQLRIKQLKEADEQSIRLGEALKLNAEESPTVAQALESISQNSTKKQPTDPQFIDIIKSKIPSNGKSPSSSSSNELEPHLLTQDERASQVNKLERELEKLHECFRLIEKDLQQVNKSMQGSLNHLDEYFKETWHMILRDLCHHIVSWLKDCSQSWHSTKQAIESI